MIIELSDFFNNPSLISLGGLTIQYYAITWLLSAVFIYLFLKYSPITRELGLTKEQVNDLVFLYGLIFGAMIGGRIGYMLFYGCLLYTSPSPRDGRISRMPSSA